MLHRDHQRSACPRDRDTQPWRRDLRTWFFRREPPKPGVRRAHPATPDPGRVHPHRDDCAVGTAHDRQAHGVHRLSDSWSSRDRSDEIGSGAAPVVVGRPNASHLGLREQGVFSADRKVDEHHQETGRRLRPKGPGRGPAGNRKKPRCTRTVTRGTLTLQGRGGTNEVRFQGHISSRSSLKLGRYALTITARDSTGLRSAPRSLSFTIVKG